MKINATWHLANKMPKNPNLEKRITWHIEHANNCLCRPVPLKFQQTIDLTQSLYDSMPVYPGDPEVTIKQALTVAKDGWNMNVISLPVHIATHVNVPFHVMEGGRTLDDYPVGSFFGTSVVFRNLESIKTGVGLFFEHASIKDEVVGEIIKKRPKFIGVVGYFETDSELEKEKHLLKEGIISFEGLINVDQLPRNKEFMFYALPLKIKNGDGSPVRAIAVI